MTIQAIIFDLDGTLIDTEPAAARAISECFKDWNMQVDAADAAFITGRTWDNAFKFLFDKYDLPFPAQHASREIMNRYRKLMETECFPVAGSREAVRSLVAEFPLGLVSGSYRAEIFWALDKLGIRSHFKVVLGAEDYPRSKPAPDGYLKAFDLLNVKPQSVLIFEDSEAGIASAKAAGARVVAITGTNHFGQNTSLADHFLPDLSGLTPEWVRALK